MPNVFMVNTVVHIQVNSGPVGPGAKVYRVGKPFQERVRARSLLYGFAIMDELLEDSHIFGYANFGRHTMAVAAGAGRMLFRDCDGPFVHHHEMIPGAPVADIKLASPLYQFAGNARLE